MEFSEQYNNIIELLKRTLQYYADENIYLQKVDDVSGLYKINLDNGEQARNTLKTVIDLEKSIKSYEDDYEKYMKDSENNINSTEEANKIINKLRNLNL
jgi:hypothetical protein